MVGRAEEKSYLQSLLHEEEHQFVAVYGRRRIGKTFLVRESFAYRFTFQHTGVSIDSIEEGTQKQAQLDQFAKSLAEAGYEPTDRLSSWSEAFEGLKDVIRRSGKGKKIIFIDELSWMDTKNSGLISALESFWNGWVTARREKDVILIVCASATYWMIDNIVNARGGLHNRLTGQIHLRPFSLGECEALLKSRRITLSRHQILQCYMVLGGVPYYWSLLKRGKSLPQNIDLLFFKDGAPLQHEYDNLYRALFKTPGQYQKIVEALSVAGKGITRDGISRQTGIPVSGELTKKLVELEHCGFIRKYIPYGYKQRNLLYQLTDHFTLFYFRFIKDKIFPEDYWASNSDSPAVNAWSGIAFERVCMDHIAQIKMALGISGVHTDVNAWQCREDPDAGIQGSQIDLVIVRKDRVINLCEMKYTENDYAADAAFDRDIRRKTSAFKIKTGTKYAIHPVLVTTYGMVNNAYSGSVQAVVTAEELFAQNMIR